MEDETLARVPAGVTTEDAVGVKVTPRCSACGTPVPDLADPKQHVCVPDAAGVVETPQGRFSKSTLDVSTAAWLKTETALRAEEAAAAAKADVVP